MSFKRDDTGKYIVGNLRFDTEDAARRYLRGNKPSKPQVIRLYRVVVSYKLKVGGSIKTFWVRDEFQPNTIDGATRFNSREDAQRRINEIQSSASSLGFGKATFTVKEI